MITAIVFVHAETPRIPEVAEAIAEIDGVSEVYSVTGTIDLIVLVRARRNEEVADIVSDRLNKVPDVVDTETHIAFRALSSHDLEAAFSLGYDDCPETRRPRLRSARSARPLHSRRDGPATSASCTHSTTRAQPGAV